MSEKYDLTFNELPFRRCLRSVQKGLFDFILHVDKSDNLILIEFPLNTWQLTFAVKMESTQSVKQIINNQALTLLIADDYQYPEEINLMLNDFSGKITKRSFYTSDKNSIITLFMLLEKGLVDVILIDKIWAEEQINKHQIQVKLLAEIILSEPQFIGYQDGNLAPIANDIFHLLSNKKE